jgi:hypothetical protein
MLRIARLVLATLAVAVLPGASATAAPQVITPGGEVTRGPVLAGEEVLWTGPGQDGEFFGGALYRAQPGGTPQRVSPLLYLAPTEEFDVDPADVEYTSVDGLAGAPGTVAVWLSAYRDRNNWFSDSLTAGPIGAHENLIAGSHGDSLSQADGCSRFPTDEVALASDAVAYVANPTCQSPFRGHVYLQTLPPAGEAKDLDGEARQVSAVRIAGGWVAWRRQVAAGSEIAVYDRSAEAIAYKVVAPGVFDVDEAGRVAVAGPDGAVAWYAPGEPLAHPVAVDGVKRVAMRGGRIAYERPGPGGTRLGTIGVAAGSQPIDLALLPPPPKFAESRWDFDGTRLAWEQPGCLPGGAAIWTEADLATPNAVPGTPECRVEIRSSVLRPGRDGFLRVKVACPVGCNRGRLLLAAPRLFRGRRGVDLDAMGPTTRSIRLKGAERRKLARLRRVPATLVAQVGEGEGRKEYTRKVTIKR